MEINEILEFCSKLKGVEETFPFDKETLVLKVGGKMFLLIPLEKHPLSFAAKANPEWSLELREQHLQITGAYHMNKTHWNTVVTDGLKPKLIFELIQHSYDLVFKSLTKKLQKEIDEL